MSKNINPQKVAVPFCLLLFTVIFFVPSARADTISFSFATNPVACLANNSCGYSFEGSGVFTATPVISIEVSGPGECLSSVTGEFNGENMTLVPYATNTGNGINNSLCGGLLLPSGDLTDNVIPFTANGQEWEIYANSQLFPPFGTADFIKPFSTDLPLVPITWSAQVNVPEPPTLLLIGMGLALLLVRGNYQRYERIRG